MHAWGCYPAHQIVTSGVTANFENRTLIKHILTISFFSFIKFPVAKSNIVPCLLLIRLFKSVFQCYFLDKAIQGLAALVKFQRSRRLLGVCYIVVKVILIFCVAKKTPLSI